MPTLFKEDWSGSGWTSSWSGSWTVGESCSHGGCVLNPDASVPTNWTNLYDDNYYYSRPPANLNNTCRVVSYDKTTYGSNYASYSLSEGIQAISYVTFYVNIWSHNFAVDDGFQMGALVSGNGIMVSRVKFVNKSDGVTEQLGAKVEIWNPAASGHPINEDPIQNDNFAWIEEQKWYRIQYMVDWTNLLWDFRIYDVPEHKIIRLLESHEGSIPTGAQLPTAGAAYPLPNFPRRVIAGSFGCSAAASGPSVEMYMGAVQWDTTGFPGPELDRPTRAYRPFTAGGLGQVWESEGLEYSSGGTVPYSAFDKGSGEDYKMVSENASERQGFIWRIQDSAPRILALRWRIKAKSHNGVANRNFMIATSWEKFGEGRTHEVYGGERGGMYISGGPEYKLFTAELFENPLSEAPWDEADFIDACSSSGNCEEGDRINGIIGSLQSVNSDNPTQPQYPGGDICEYWAEFIVAPNDGQDYSYLTNGPRFGGVTDSTIRVWVRCYGPAKVRIMFGTSSANVKNSTPTSLQGDTKITDNPSVDNAVAANDYSITIDLVESCSTLSSLSADTKYYFDVYVDGVSTYQMERDPLIGTAESWDVLPECRTFPTEGVWADFDFLVGADKHDAAENYQIYESMGGTFTTPRFYIDLGDEMASDADVLDLQEFAYPDDRIEFARLTSQRMGYKYRRGLNAFNVRFATNIERRMPIDRIWSDHDYAADNATKTGWVPRSNITDGLAIYWRKLLDANSDSYAFELTRVNSRYGGKSTLAIYGWYCTVASIDSATENSDGSWEVTFTYSSPSWAAGDNLSQPVEENNVGWNRSVDFGQLENWDEGNDRMTIATEPSTGNPLEVGDVLRGGGRLVVSRTDGFMLHVHGSSYGNDGYYRARSAGLFWDGPSVFELGHTITADEDPIPNAQNSGPNGVTVDFYTFRTYNCLDGFRQSGPHYDWPANDLTGVVTSGEGAQFSDIGSIYRQFHYYNATNEIYIEEGDSCIIDGPGGTPTATVRYVDTVLNVLVIEMDTPSNVFESGTISAVAPDGPWSATILTEATVPEYGPGVLNFPTYSKYGVYPGMIVYRFEDSSLSDDTVTFGIVTKNYGTYIELSGLVPYDSNGGPVSFTAGNRYRIKTGGLWHSFKYGNAEFFFMDVCYKGDKLDLTDPFGQDVVRSKGIAGAPEILNPGLPGCDRLDGTREGVAPKFTGTVNEYLKNGMRDTTTNFETGGPFGDGVVRGDVVHNVDSDQWAIVYSVSGSSITLRDKFYYGGPKELFVLGSGQYTYAIYESGASDHGSRTANERAGHIQREWLINSLNDSTADWRFLLSQDPLIGVKPWDYNEHWETCDGVLDAQRGYLKEKIDNSLSMGGLVGFGGDQHFAALSDGQPSSSDLPFPFINVSPLYSEWIPAITHTPHDKNSWMVDGKYAACGRDQSAGYPVGIRNWGAYGAVQATLNQLTITIRETDGTVMNNSAMVMNNPPGPNIGDMTMTVTKAGNYGLGYIPARMVADGAFSSTGGVLVAQGMLTTSASLSGSFSTTGAISVLLVDLYSSVSWEGSFSTSGATYTMKPMAYVVKGVAPEEDFDMVMNFTPIEVLTNKYIGKYKKHWVDSGNDAFKKVVSKMNVDSENIYGVIEDELELPWIKDDAMASEVLTFWTTFRGKERITLELDLMWLSTNIEVGSYMSLDMTGWSDGILAPFQTGNFMVIEKSYEWAQERRVLKLLQI